MDPKDFDESYEENIESSESSFIKDVNKNDDESDTSVGTIITFVENRFKKAEDARVQDEERWLRAYRNYRGLYSPQVQFTEAERSRVFVKVTKTKTLAAYGQIVDVLFGNKKFPIVVDPTSLPEGVADTVHFDSNPDPAAEEAFDTVKDAFTPFTTEESRLAPGETMNQLKERMGALAGTSLGL